MTQKKDGSKFTIQFNPADPQHAQTIDILNQQGRRKAQFIANAVIHYLHCSDTPNIPQSAPLDTSAIEAIVRRIMEEENKTAVIPPKETVPEKPICLKQKTESIQYDNAAELLGEDGIDAIVRSIARFRK